MLKEEGNFSTDINGNKTAVSGFRLETRKKLLSMRETSFLHSCSVVYTIGRAVEGSYSTDIRMEANTFMDRILGCDFKTAAKDRA